MPQSKHASSQAAWAFLIEGVSAARLHSHRLRHQLNRILKLVERSEHRDHLFQVAGDVIVSFPKRMDQLDVELDRTLLGLSEMGREFLSARLPIDDKEAVDQALEGASPPLPKPQSDKDAMARRIASAWIGEDDR